MSERRSSRRKRIVNYHQFTDKDSDGDDDFESSPVLSKRGRSAEERDQKKTSNSPLVSRDKVLQQEPEVPVGPPKKARQSRDERQFDKDTNQALRESMGATVCQDPESPEPAPSRLGLKEGKDSDYQPLNEEENDDYSSGYDEASDSDFETSGPPPPKKSKPTKMKSVTAQSNGQPRTARARTEAAARKTSEEGGVPTTSKTVESVSRTRHTIQKTTPAAIASTVLPNSLSSKSTTVLPPKSPLPGCHGTPGLGKRKLPNWTPPGPAGSGENRTATSGGTPLIRVGLSRNARVKPLHNKCLVHHKL